MNKIKRLLIIPFVFILCALFIPNVYAIETFKMEVSNSGPVANGSNVTLSFTATNLGGITNGFDGYEGYINFDSSKLEYVSMSNVVSGWVNYPAPQSGKIKFLGYDDNPPSNAKSSDTKIMTVVFKALVSEGTTDVTITNIKGSTGSGIKIVADDTSTTVSFKEAEKPKSNDATLKELSVGGQTLTPAFSPSVTSYSLTVPNTVTGLDVNAITNDAKASAKVSGNSGFKVGSNNITITVTAEDGSKKSYTITVKREDAKQDPTPGKEPEKEPPKEEKPTQVVQNTTVVAKSNNNLLKAVKGIDGLELSSDKTTYNISVPFETNSLTISAEAEHPSAKVEISNSNITGLKVDETKTITINVTAEDGSLRVYTFNIKRSKYTSNTGLKELTVNYIDVFKKNPGLDDDFTLTVNSDVEDVVIKATPYDKSADATVIGNSYLKYGENNFVIRITDKNGFSKDYSLTINRKKPNIFISYWWLLLILLIFTLLLIYLIRRSNKNKELLEKIEEEEKFVELKNKNIALQMENSIDEKLISMISNDKK